jgi:uncharacterized membrane protein
MEAQGAKIESREKFTAPRKPAETPGSVAVKEKGAAQRSKRVALAGAAATLAFTGGYLLYRAKIDHWDFLGTLGKRVSSGERELTIKKSVVVNRSPAEVFNYWRNFENFPRFMKHIESVRRTGKMVSHWIARAPGGRRIEWDSEITEIKEGERIRWRSLSGSDVHNRGQVTFRQAPEGSTEVEVEFTYHPEGGRADSPVAKLLNFLTVYYIQRDLLRFKRIMEKGEPSLMRELEKTLAQT